MDCAGDRIAVPGEGEFSDLRDAFAHYWKNAFITDLSSVGMLNQEKPKVKLYNLIDSVKIIAEPTQLQWRIKMEIFSSNGGMLKQEITYNAPTDGLKNMREGCSRLAAGLDKAVAWSILKTFSDSKIPRNGSAWPRVRSINESCEHHISIPTGYGRRLLEVETNPLNLQSPLS